jgi:hypothetical protein
MVIFVIYISAFSSFFSSAEGKRRSSTQAKRKQHDLKGQKFLEAARPERAEALSPGHRPGCLWTQTCRPVRAKAFNTKQLTKLLPLQGALLIAIIPRALSWAKSFCPFRACCFYELLPFTFALPFGQRFSIPLRAGDRWFRACGAKLAKLVSIRFHIRYFLDLPLSMCSYVKSFFMKKVSKYHLLAECRDKLLIYNRIEE